MSRRDRIVFVRLGIYFGALVGLTLALRATQSDVERLESRLTALEARRPIDLHVTVDRPTKVAEAVYRTLPPPSWMVR